MGEKDKRGVSRRTFLACGATAAMGFAAFAASGCATGSGSDQQSSKQSDATEIIEDVSYPVEIHDADVLVIGSGVSGLTAAHEAAQLGRSVTIVDKAQYAHSGTSGYNWGHLVATNEFVTNQEALQKALALSAVRPSCGLDDQNVALAVNKAKIEVSPVLFGENLGMAFERQEDGTCGSTMMGAIGKPNPDSQVVLAGWYTRFLAQKTKSQGVEVQDNTMFIDILRDSDGNCNGGIGLDLRRGVLQVWRAKSVIMAMGTFNWMCGWHGMRPQSMCGPEMTGDAAAIMLNNGLSVENMEFFAADNNPRIPGAISYCMGVGLEMPNCERGIMNDGTRIIKYFAENPSQGGADALAQLIAGEIYHERATENGGVWLDVSDFEHMEHHYRRAKDNYKRHFDYDIPEDKIEVFPEQWQSFCTPKINESMQTEIPGLYIVGEVTMHNAIAGCMGSAHLAAIDASARAASLEASTVDWNKVVEVGNHVFDLLEAEEPANAIRPVHVMREIQVAHGEGLSLVRNEESIQKALTEFERIKSEDLPKMYVADKSRAFNMEWRKALETEKMIDVAIGVAMAADARKESRYFQVRTDYPEQNNDDYLVHIGISKQGDEFSVDTREVDMSIISKDVIPTMITSTNINSWNR